MHARPLPGCHVTMFPRYHRLEQRGGGRDVVDVELVELELADDGGVQAHHRRLDILLLIESLYLGGSTCLSMYYNFATIIKITPLGNCDLTH